MTDTQVREPNGCHTAECSAERTTYCPRLDIQETDNEIVLYGDLPGVLPEDLDIRFENGELTIQGKVSPRHSDLKKVYREYGVGNFYRSLSVSETIDVDAISAELNSGVLTLRLPKAESVKPRRIKVQG